MMSCLNGFGGWEMASDGRELIGRERRRVSIQQCITLKGALRCLVPPLASSILDVTLTWSFCKSHSHSFCVLHHRDFQQIPSLRGGIRIIYILRIMLAQNGACGLRRPHTFWRIFRPATQTRAPVDLFCLLSHATFRSVCKVRDSG